MSIRIEFDSGKIADSPVARFKWRQAVAEFVDQAQPIVLDALKREAPVAPRGAGRGRLRRSIRSRRNIDAASAQVTFAAHVPYARYVLEGTRPHRITPRMARALHWVDGSGSHFARGVNHPGTKPNPFPARAREAVQSDLAERFRAAVRDAMK